MPEHPDERDNSEQERADELAALEDLFATLAEPFGPSFELDAPAEAGPEDVPELLCRRLALGSDQAGVPTARGRR